MNAFDDMLRIRIFLEIAAFVLLVICLEIFDKVVGKNELEINHEVTN